MRSTYNEACKRMREVPDMMVLSMKGCRSFSHLHACLIAAIYCLFTVERELQLWLWRQREWQS